VVPNVVPKTIRFVNGSGSLFAALKTRPLIIPD
jgi:hypothetical protein